MTDIRLLACQQCKTIEELDDFDGPPEYDDLLNTLVSRHRTASGEEHIGALFRVNSDEWAKGHAKDEVTKQIAAKMEGGETGLGHAFYDLKDTFQEDAAKCFSDHLRNPACSDYRSDAKRLSAGTEAERKAAGLAPHRSNRFLCDHCVVQSLVEQAARAKALK